MADQGRLGLDESAVGTAQQTHQEPQEEGRDHPEVAELHDNQFGRHCHTINGNTADIHQLHEDQVAMVTRMVSYEEKVCHCGDGSDRLSDLSYGEPVKTSPSSPLFPGCSTPSPIPIPAPVAQVTGQDTQLPSLLEGSSDKENSIPGTQQSVVTELVAIVEEDILDHNEESSHIMARRVQDEMVRLVLGQKCCSKAHPSLCDCCFYPFPQLGDGGDGFPFSCRRQGEQNIGGGDRERFQRTRHLHEGLNGNGDIETNHSTDGSWNEADPLSSGESSSSESDGPVVCDVWSSGHGVSFLQWSLFISS